MTRLGENWVTEMVPYLWHQHLQGRLNSQLTYSYHRYYSSGKLIEADVKRIAVVALFNLIAKNI